LITTNEVKRNCIRVTECGKEAWSINCEPMNKNRIEGVAKQGERAIYRKALVIKVRTSTDWACQGCHDLKLSNRPVRTRMPGGVAGPPPIMEAPYADLM
jgi:hypothetical protein